ncbi:Aste57867_10758 [Aphanomyces stellatus]|uniref:Aste57867_10758 protein n=1 Tax=Aphanomyces stellatus TaxID=120398 RepID=A0A485KRN5_9STRA|nr:hypothetical protein As57867_010718 [Aphanomyces stellatus]VFT87628.1 Aste57867_10758 [Aphanomyces stellatus]
MTIGPGKKDAKLHSPIPRRLRVQVDYATQVRLQGCVFPAVGLFVKTKLRGAGTRYPTFATPLQATPSSELAWEHQVYEFDVTEGDMYTRVLEFTVHRVNCFKHEDVVGRATLPLSEFEENRLSGVMPKHLKLDREHLDMELHVSIEVWNRHDVADAAVRECWEHERFVPFVGWSKAHLLPSDLRAAFRAGNHEGSEMEDVVGKTPDGHVETLGWSTGAWFYAESFGGPWHNSNARWPCRRRQLTQVCRLEKMDDTYEEPPPPVKDMDADLKARIALVDLSIEEILQKHNVQVADY